ncbi:MAG: histidinol-phosphatase [Treponema sp.]|jgi:histidinol-phosphatase (PHP family)|nr:histidinol-phosphatase [Treponema sp.]
MNTSQMNFSSMHTHTLFCDGKDDIETMCRAAFEKKMCAIGFSAHMAFPKHIGLNPDWHIKEDRLEEYAAEVLAAKNRWQGKLDVYLGFEVDYIKGIRSAKDNDIKALNPDFIIGSVHFLVPINGAEPFTVDGPPEEFEKGLYEGFGGDEEALMHSYYDAMTEMIAVGGFDILGHADIVKVNRNNRKCCNTESESVRQKEIAELAANAVVVAEINTGGINKKRIDETYPSLSFLHFFRKCEIPVIITADAHRAVDIDGHYNVALYTLINAGYSEHTLFNGRIDGKASWRKEKIIF